MDLELEEDVGNFSEAEEHMSCLGKPSNAEESISR